MGARWAMVLVLSGCSLTPIPDVSSNWQDPCDASVRLCRVDFSLKAGSEDAAELRGDFRDGGWTSGVPMARSADGGVWQTSVALTWGVPVAYKFYLDHSRWVLDPTNGRTVRDDQGNVNSALDPVTCQSWACAPSTPR